MENRKQSDLPNRKGCEYSDNCPIREIAHDYCDRQDDPEDCPQYDLYSSKERAEQQIYMLHQELDITNFRIELSHGLGHLISRETAFHEWVRQGRAKEFHDNYKGGITNNE